MKINIINITDSDKDFKTLVDEYTKRLSKEIKITNIRPDKSGDIAKIMANDTQKIIDSLSKNTDFKILLSIKGKKINTVDFANMIDQNHNITLIIGGPYGLDESKLQNLVDFKLSFSDMTFPHGLAKVILLEQIFRAKTILENKNYHY